MVGRETRAARCSRDAFDAGRRDGRACQLFTVLGAAGVGKSRLVGEFLGSARRRERRRAAAACPTARASRTGRSSRWSSSSRALPSSTDAAASDPRAARRDGSRVARRDEIAWAFRKLLEAAARDARSSCVFDDIHWGEADVPRPLEHVADLVTRRTDPARSAWRGPSCSTGGRAGAAASSTRRPCCSSRSTRRRPTQLIESLGGRSTTSCARGSARPPRATRSSSSRWSRLVRRVGRRDDVAVPPTIQALLAARLDQLDAPERERPRARLGRGQRFHRGAVQALAPEERAGRDAARGARSQGARAARQARSCPARTPSASGTC